QRVSTGHRQRDTSTAADAKDEQWGPVSALLTEVGSGNGVQARVSRRVERRPEPDPPAESTDVVVTGSGNLAFIYFTQQPTRLTWEEIDRLHPSLVDGLVGHDG